MKKRSYLLLELTIALSVVGFVSYLLIRQPYDQMKKEWEFLAKMEKERKIELDLWEIKNEAYEHVSEWKLGKSHPVQYGDRRYSVYLHKPEKSDELKKYYLVSVKKGKDAIATFYIELVK